MVHNIDAIFDNGVFRPIEPLALPNGSRVHLRIENQNENEQVEVEQPNHELPTLLERMKDFIGVIDNLPPDASINHDHYLYGTPKRQ